MTKLEQAHNESNSLMQEITNPKGICTFSRSASEKRPKHYLTGADLYGATGVHYAMIGPVDGWMVTLTLTSDGLRISAGCRYFSLPEAREHWSDSSRWTKGAAPEHGARMRAAVDALLALTVDWPEKLPEVSR